MVETYRFLKQNPDTQWVSQANAWFCGYQPNQAWFDWFYVKLTEKINRVYSPLGKGSKAERRRKRVLDAGAECKWCGSRTGKLSRVFCDRSCAQSYGNY